MKTLLKARERVITLPDGMYRALIPAARLVAQQAGITLPRGIDRLNPPGRTVAFEVQADMMLWERVQEALGRIWFPTMEIRGRQQVTTPFLPAFRRKLLLQVGPREWRYAEDPEKLPNPYVTLWSETAPFLRRTVIRAAAFDDLAQLIPDPPAVEVTAIWSNLAIPPVPEAVRCIIDAYSTAHRFGVELEFHEGGM